MDATALLAQYGPYVFILYVLVKEVIPRVAPQLVKSLDKRITAEERLFTVIETNAKVLLELSHSLLMLSDTLKEIDNRINAIEENLKDNSSALRIASRLIAKD